MRLPVPVSISAPWLVLAALLILRLPSLVQPAGGDQGLYLYEASRMHAGEVLYRDVWDQKPPGIATLYSILLRVWPHESVVPLADATAAALTAVLLMFIARRRFSRAVGFGAAAIFLLLGDPYLQRMSGVYVRGQCEPFMALAVTAAVALLSADRRGRGHLFGAGLALAAAIWLKYNAVTYALPVVVAIWSTGRGVDVPFRERMRDAAWVVAGAGLVTIATIGYFAVHGALTDLRLATIDYNLRYADEAHPGRLAMIGALVSMPFERARVDMLWFVGGIGAAAMAWRFRESASARLVIAWLAAAMLAIAINGRYLPNYFVQANPALALAAAAGLAWIWRQRGVWRAVLCVLIAAGLWRVGADAPVAGARWAGVHGLIENLRFDVGYARGDIARSNYLARFKGVKFDALENARLTEYLRDTTTPVEPVLVFGFSGGSVGWAGGRVSPTRFFWSRPVLIGFEAQRPGYGQAGLLDDLQKDPPVVVALQKDEWRSADFFIGDPALRQWLETSYALAWESDMFTVWRRR